MARANTDQSRESLLGDFVRWSASTSPATKRGKPQIFLDHLFRAFGQRGSLDVGGTAEMRIRKASEDGGGTSFADYVWKPVVLIEMKKRGADLSKHYRQAFDYWVRLVPDRPQYVILCNFDEFWVYDFNIQLDSPKDKVKLEELAIRWGPLAFLFPTNEPPKFGNDREAVTRESTWQRSSVPAHYQANSICRGVIISTLAELRRFKSSPTSLSARSPTNRNADAVT